MTNGFSELEDRIFEVEAMSSNWYELAAFLRETADNLEAAALEREADDA